MFQKDRITSRWDACSVQHDLVRAIRKINKRFTQKGLDRQTVFYFQETIYAFFKVCGRALPWRQTDDPYRILVSEIMLQQTQVARVLVKYEEFLRNFPTIEVLTQATLSDILRVWQGMGYNRRALSLKRIADLLATSNQGKVPRALDDLKALPGIGHTTAAAVMAFAFNVPVTFIETNIRAVYLHVFFPGRQGVQDSAIYPIVQATIDRKKPRVWYYALMDFGVLLKELFANPNQRSAHFKRQSAFNGSDRQLRGNVLKYLLKHKGASLHAMVGVFSVSKSRLQLIVRQLEKEGFLKKRRTCYTIK